MDTITTPQSPFNPKTITLTPPQPPPSVAELRRISAALSQFLHDYDDLHNHISSVNEALDEKLSAHYKGSDFALVADNDNSVENVLEGSVVVPNSRPSVVLTADSVLKGVVSGQKCNECVLSDNVLEGAVLGRKRKECVVDSDDDVVVLEQKRKECIVDSDDDDARMHASSDSFVNDSDRVVVNDDVSGDVTRSESDEGVKNCEESDCDGVKDVLDGVVVMEGKSEVSVSESECERSDEYANYGKKREESECDGVVNDVLEGVVVTEGKGEGSVSESEPERERERAGSDVDERMYESSNHLKKCEERDCDRVVSVDLTEIGLEGKGDANVRMCQSVKNDEEVIDALVTMEESDCDEIIIDLSEAVFPEQNLNGSESDHIVAEFGDARVSGKIPNCAASECEHGDDDVRMDESPNSQDSCRETDSEREEIGASKNAEEIGDEGEKIDAAKNVEETGYDRAINEHLEETAVIVKNPTRVASKCDDVRRPQSSSSMEISEETEDEDGGIEESKKPEDADYERIVTELLEDIDVAPKPNRTASNPDQSYDKPQSPSSSKNQHEETGVSMEPGETDIVKDPSETDMLEKPEEIGISAKPVETGVLEKLKEIDILKNPVETDVSGKPEEIDIRKNPEESDVLFKKPGETDVSKKPEETDVPTDALEKPENVEILKPAVSELKRLCKSMNGREMNKYLVKHISNIEKLRTELPKALKLAINPAKLVLDSIDMFFLQSCVSHSRGSCEYLNDKIDRRQASVLILECFVMISGDGIEISGEDEAYVTQAANLWKNRMIKEREGLRNIKQADARGLLLLISGFGISDRLFSTVDIMNLMMASNVKGISNILCRSIVLMPKIPEVIDMMVMSKLEVEAADIAYTFGLEYKCHPLTILKKFLRYIIDDIESRPPLRIEAITQQLDGLISVKECVESHNIDPSKVLPEFKIEKKIHHLKKELKLQIQKRKPIDIESSPNPNHQEAKRTPSSHQTMSRGISSYNRPMQPGYNYLDFNPNLSSNYTPPSLLGPPPLPVNITNSVTSGLAGPNGNIRPYYGWQDESALGEKYLVPPYPIQSQMNDSRPSLTGLYGRQPGYPVCMPGHPGYPGYFPSGGFPAWRGTGRPSYY